MTNEELIAALEDADGPSRELMLQAFDAIFTDEDTPSHKANLFWFVTMLDAQAWESAALMLVSDGWDLDLFVRSKYHRAVLENIELDCEVEANNASTPANAIVIAALKAKGEG